MEPDAQSRMESARRIQSLLVGMQENADLMTSRLVRGSDGWMYDVLQTNHPHFIPTENFPNDPPPMRLPPLDEPSDIDAAGIEERNRARLHSLEFYHSTHPIVDVPIEMGSYEYTENGTRQLTSAGHTSVLSRAIAFDTWPAPFEVYSLGKGRYGVARGWLRTWYGELHREYQETTLHNITRPGVVGVNMRVTGQPDSHDPKPDQDFTITQFGEIEFLPFPVNVSNYRPRKTTESKDIDYEPYEIEMIVTSDWNAFMPLAFVYPNDGHILPVGRAAPPSNPSHAKDGIHHGGALVVVREGIGVVEPLFQLSIPQ